MEKRTFLKIFIISILLCCVVISAFLIYFDTISNSHFIEENKYVMSYNNVSVSQAKEIINSSNNLTIIYCEGGCKPCSWKKVKIDSSAIWATGTKKFWNSTNNFLIYDKSGGNKSIDYCERLYGHIYGTIYRLDGGFDAWKKEN